MTHWKNARAWVCATPAWPEDGQVAAVKAYCTERGWKPSIYRASQKMTRDDFVRSIRPEEVVVLPRLDVLLPQKAERPARQLTLLLVEIAARAGLVVEVNSGASTADPDAWKRAVADAVNRVSSGRKPLKKAQARIMARKRWDSTKPGVVKTWLDDNPDARARREKWEVVYKSRKFKSFEAARAALPDELRDLSQKSIWLIFGARTK